MNKNKISKDILIDLYIKQNLAAQEIANKFGFKSYVSIISRLKKFNIRIKHSNDYRRKDRTSYNVVQDFVNCEIGTNGEYKLLTDKNDWDTLGGTHKKIKVRHNTCGKTFTPTFNNLKSNSSKCPHCRSYRMSFREICLRNELEYIFGFYTLPQDRIINDICSIDILLPNKIIIEYDGFYYHSGTKKLNRDKRKTTNLENLGYTVVRLREEKPNGEKLGGFFNHAISVPQMKSGYNKTKNIKKIVNIVIEYMTSKLHIKVPNIKEYLVKDDIITKQKSDVERSLIPSSYPKHTEKEKEKMSIRNGGKLFTVYDLNKKNIVGYYINIGKCSRDIGIDRHKISGVLNNFEKNHKCGKYFCIFGKYTKQKIEQKHNILMREIKLKKSKIKTISIYNVITKEIRIFDTVKDIIETMGFDNASITYVYNCLSKKQKTFNGFVFKSGKHSKHTMEKYFNNYSTYKMILKGNKPFVIVNENNIIVYLGLNKSECIKKFKIGKATLSECLNSATRFSNNKYSARYATSDEITKYYDGLNAFKLEIN